MLGAKCWIVLNQCCCRVLFFALFHCVWVRATYVREIENFVQVLRKGRKYWSVFLRSWHFFQIFKSFRLIFVIFFYYIVVFIIIFFILANIIKYQYLEGIFYFIKIKRKWFFIIFSFYIQTKRLIRALDRKVVDNLILYGFSTLKLNISFWKRK